MKATLQILIFIIATCCCNISFAQVNKLQIDSILNNSIKPDGPGAIVFVKKGKDIIYQKAFGKANIELKTNMTTNAVFNIASISKEFTAVSILQLLERGKLSLDDPINQYIPDYSKNGDSIKIKHLLSQTSGLQSHTDMKWAATEADKHFDSTLSFINYFKRDTIKFKPGERHDYANTNYMLLGYIIENVSGVSYATYLEQHIFKPLQMTHTVFPYDGQVINNKPQGYEIKEDALVLARPHSYSQTKGPGSIHSTVGDLAKWYDGLMASKVISRESLMQAWSPFILNNGSRSLYGLGFYIDRKFNKTAIFHNGFIFGYSTSDLYFPEDDLLILITSNISDINIVNTNSLVFDVASTLYQKEAPKLTEALLDTYTGTYKMKAGFSAKVFREGLQLLISVDGQPANKLYAEATTHFVVKDFPAKAAFIAPANGETMQIVLSIGPDTFEGVKSTE